MVRFGREAPRARTLLASPSRRSIWSGTRRNPSTGRCCGAGSDLCQRSTQRGAGIINVLSAHITTLGDENAKYVEILHSNVSLNKPVKTSEKT